VYSHQDVRPLRHSTTLLWTPQEWPIDVLAVLNFQSLLYEFTLHRRRQFRLAVYRWLLVWHDDITVVFCQRCCIFLIWFLLDTFGRRQPQQCQLQQFYSGSF